MTKEKCIKLANLHGCEFVEIGKPGGLEYEVSAPEKHRLSGHDLHALVYWQDCGTESARMFYARVYKDMLAMLAGVEPCQCEECEE